MNSLVLSDYLNLSNTVLISRMETLSREHFQVGYELYPEISVVQPSEDSNDPSVSLIGSTTNVLKKTFERGPLQSPIFLFQRKLRTQNVSLHFSSEEPRYASSFVGIGAWSPVESYNLLCKSLLTFLKEKLGIPLHLLAISACVSNEEVWRPWQEQGCKLLLVENQDRFEWEFGDSSLGKLHGIGCYIEACAEADSSVLGDIASVEFIQTQDGQIVAVEFGLGFETTIAHLRKMQGVSSNPIWSTGLADSLAHLPKTAKNLYLLDCLNTVGCLLSTELPFYGKLKGFGYASTILKRYLKALKFYWVEAKFSNNPDSLMSIDILSEHFTINPDKLAELREYLAEYEKRFAFFTQCADSLFTSGFSESLTISNLKQAVKDMKVWDLIEAANMYQLVNYQSTEAFRQLQIKHGVLVFDPSQSQIDSK